MQKESRRNKSYCCYKAKPKILLQILINDSTIKAGIEPHQDEMGNLETCKKMSELLIEQYNSVFSLIKYPKDFFRHPQANTLSEMLHNTHHKRRHHRYNKNYLKTLFPRS